MNRWNLKFSVNILLILCYLIVARLSCIAFSNVPLMSISYVFLYGVIFIVIFLIKYPRIEKREFTCLILLGLYVLFVVVKTVSNTGNLFNTEAFNAYVLLFLFFIYMFIKKQTSREQKTIFFVALIGFLFTYIYSINRLMIDPNLSRMAAANIVSESGVDNLNAIGGFDTVYGSILVVIILLYLIGEQNSRLIKIIFYLSLLSAVIFIIMASYATALVLLITVLSLWIIQKNRFFGIVAITLFVIVALNHVYVGQLISELSKHIQYSGVLSEKINEIGIILQTGEAMGTLAGDEGRLARMGWSWNAFLQYPIFGAYGKADVSIGYHSELFDSMGKFGILGFGLLIMFFIYFLIDIYKKMSTKAGKRCCIFVFVLYSAVFVLNPALYTQQVLPIFVFLPVFQSWTDKNNEKEKVKGSVKAL